MPVSRPGKRQKAVESRDYPQVTREDVLEHRLPLRDADCIYLEHFLDEAAAQEAYEALKDLDTCRSFIELVDRLIVRTVFRPTLRVYGKEIQQSRAVAAYATTVFELKYSGASIPMHTDYPEALKALQLKVEERLGASFNHVMLNLYSEFVQSEQIELTNGR